MLRRSRASALCCACRSQRVAVGPQPVVCCAPDQSSSLSHVIFSLAVAVTPATDLESASQGVDRSACSTPAVALDRDARNHRPLASTTGRTEAQAPFPVLTFRRAVSRSSRSGRR